MISVGMSFPILVQREYKVSAHPFTIGINPISELRRNIRGYQTTGPLPTTADPYDYYE